MPRRQIKTGKKHRKAAKKTRKGHKSPRISRKLRRIRGGALSLVPESGQNSGQNSGDSGDTPLSSPGSEPSTPYGSPYGSPGQNSSGESPVFTGQFTSDSVESSPGTDLKPKSGTLTPTPQSDIVLSPASSGVSPHASSSTDGSIRADASPDASPDASTSHLFTHTNAWIIELLNSMDKRTGMARDLMRCDFDLHESMIDTISLQEVRKRQSLGESHAAAAERDARLKHLLQSA